MNFNVTLKFQFLLMICDLQSSVVRRGVETRRASTFRNEPRAVLRLRLSAINPISVRRLSHYRRGVPRCHFHSPRNFPFSSRRAPRLRTRLYWPSLLAWKESVEIRPGCRCGSGDGVPTWSMGSCLFLVSSQHQFSVLPLIICRSPSERSVTRPTFSCVMPMM